MAAHGMGGVGKTTAAAALVRDADVRGAYERLLWVSVSHEPDVLTLLKVLHFQLTSTKLPASVDEERDAVQLLREAAKGIKALLVLDDVWKKEHLEALRCLDPSVGSVCIVTSRVHNLAEGDEVSCGLLSREESVNLLLKSAGLEHLVDAPPDAAYEAVECCGRLALALPIAGGMIRELDELWEAELVPMLREELSTELSVEARIVNASLRCVDQAQRAGVEALFVVFGCFAEDNTVPPAALDILAPIVCRRAASTPSSKLKVRKWLASLLKASLLSKHAEAGIGVHDLVRDVMVARAGMSASGMVGLQREVLALFLEAYEGSSTSTDPASVALCSFLVQSIRHHASLALRPTVPLREDELLMRALCQHGNLVCVSTISGIGLDRTLAEIASSESAGSWWAAAQLWSSVATFRGQRGGSELKQVLSAVRRLPEETDEAMALELKTIESLVYISDGGYAFGSLEDKELRRRQAELAERLASAAGGGAESSSAQSKYEALKAEGMSRFGEAIQIMGLLGYVPATPEMLDDSLGHLKSCFAALHHATLVAPDRVSHDFVANILATFATSHGCRQHRFADFKREAYMGAHGALLRENVERRDFESVHIAHKTTNMNMDMYLFGANEAALVLWYGDLQTARVGWAKQVEAWKQIEALVASGERSWGEYLYESNSGVTGFAAGALLAAGELSTLRELCTLTFAGRALRDPAVMADYEAAFASFPFAWLTSDDEGNMHRMVCKESCLLQCRLLAAVSDEDGALDTEELRGWLPSPEEAMRIARCEHAFDILWNGGGHPTLLCAMLYCQMGAWGEATTIVEGFLSLGELTMHAAARIEAFRLLARCHGARGDTLSAREALEQGVGESKAPGYVWLEHLCLKDMLTTVPDQDKAEIRARMEAVSADFHV